MPLHVTLYIFNSLNYYNELLIDFLVLIPFVKRNDNVNPIDTVEF